MEPHGSNGVLSASSHESLPHQDLCESTAAVGSELVQEELASHDSFLEYIDSMLMDESFEDSSWQVFVPKVLAGDGVQSLAPSLTDRYEHIFRGFHEILDESTLDPSAFESVDRVDQSNGQGYKAVANGFENPAGILFSDYPATSYLQHSEDGSGMDFLNYDLPLMHTAEMAFGVAQSKTPMYGNYFESAGEGQVRGSLHVGPGEWLQFQEPSVQAQEDTLRHVEPNDSLLLYNPDSKELHMKLSTGKSSGAALSAHTKDGQSIPPEHSFQVAEGQDVSLVRNADLPAELYAQLFDECPFKDNGADLSVTKVASGRHPSKGRKDEALANPVDLKSLLLTSAKTLGDGNVKRAMDILQQIQQEGASPHGSGLQRVVHYFTEAITARLSGMGNTLYKAIASTAQLPSPVMMLKAYKMVFEACPYVKIAYHFCNQYILKAAHGASRIHIVDYGILYGFQWPCLIYALAHRPGGPPFLRITGIEYPVNPADINPTATTEGTSSRLREYAKTYHVPFEYHAISVSEWEDIDTSLLRISQDEVLVLNSFNRLSHIHDENSAQPSRRDRLLMQMRSLNPRLFVLGSMNAGHSSPFFAPRFREAFYYYSNMFDVLHTTMMNDSPERLMFEREIMGRSILNVVACEGVERIELPETYKPLQARIERAGFRQLPMISSVWDKARVVMKAYHRDFNLLKDSNRWVLLGWRGRSMQALSAWEPA